MYSPASSKVTLCKDRTSNSLSVVLAPAVYKERTECDRREPAPPHGHRGPGHAAQIQPGCKENAATTTSATTSATATVLPRPRWPGASASSVGTEPEASPSTGESSVPGERQAGGQAAQGHSGQHAGLVQREGADTDRRVDRQALDGASRCQVQQPQRGGRWVLRVWGITLAGLGTFRGAYGKAGRVSEGPGA